VDRHGNRRKTRRTHRCHRQGNPSLWDAKEDNGPDGIARGFKDYFAFFRSISAGRGAVIGRVGDAEIAQPFLLGAHRDVVAPVAGPLPSALIKLATTLGTVPTPSASTSLLPIQTPHIAPHAR